MRDAINSSGAHVTPTAEYLTVVSGVSIGVAKTLDTLASGRGIRPALDEGAASGPVRRPEPARTQSRDWGG